ncbi:MAG: FtsX-like permease family protein [Chromatiaceae bacterium]|nr:FtsX-like permease family protein [Chromatiaceae bacterium]
MSAWRLALRLLRQDWRSGELSLLAAALVLTVAAVSAVGFFSDRIERALAREGSALIAADLAIESGTPLPAFWRAEAEARGLETSALVEFRSVVLADGRPQLVRVKAVEGGYPLRGRLRLRAAPEAPEASAEGPPAPGELWVESRLLHLLDQPLGAMLGLGEARLRLGAILSHEPDAGATFFNLAPRVLMNGADLDATGLLGAASRATHRLLIAGEPGALADYRRWLEARLTPGVELRDAASARPEFATAVERATRFLHLATLATLLVAGAAMALASHRLVERQTEAVAIMRCLGMRRHLLLRLFALRLLFLALGASLLGVALGWLAQFGLVALLAEGFGAALPAPSLAPLVAGVVTGLALLLGFALPPLPRLARVSPLRALRGDLGAPPASMWLTLGLALAVFAGLIWWRAGEFALAWKLLLGLLGAGLALLAVVGVLLWIAARLAREARGLARLALAGLTRRPGLALLQIGGFGLGILALLLLAVVRLDLLESWRETLPEEAPNHFLLNIQPHEVEPLKDWLRTQGLGEVELYPMISGRLTGIAERAIEPSDYPDARAQRLAAREFNLSYSERPQADNRILEGRWWTDAGAEPAFSVERELAETLGIRLGDRLTFEVNGRSLSAPVTSLREVQWDSFNVNFFVIGSPALLGAEPATFLTSIHLDARAEALLPELVRRFPSLTLLDVEALIDEVRAVIERGVLAVESVFLLTLAAGLLVMIAGIQASLEQRRAEHGVLRTLGVGRRALLGALALEFAIAGALAGLLAVIFAELIGWMLAVQLFELPFSLNPWLWLGGILGSALAVGAAGTAATYPLLVQPPLQTLRRAH